MLERGVPAELDRARQRHTPPGGGALHDLQHELGHDWSIVGDLARAPKVPEPARGPAAGALPSHVRGCQLTICKLDYRMYEYTREKGLSTA